MIVADTHALVWYFQADPRLGSAAVGAIEAARRKAVVLISPITTWEIGMLTDRNRVSLGMSPDRWFDRVLETAGFALASLEVRIGLDAGTLPDGIHGDPADRLIIATARAFDCDVLTSDVKILAYAAGGHVKAIDARV